MKNIALIGFMGTGKSSVGSLLAHRIGLDFVDMDEMIAQRAGKSIPTIFKEDGEAAFRAMERSLARELSEQTGHVISTGGGIVLNPDNVSDLSRTGLVVCLTATPEAILKRVGRDTNRPLLDVPDKLGKICELMDRRQQMYDAAPNQIDTTDLTEEQVASRIESLYTS